MLGDDRAGRQLYILLHKVQSHGEVVEHAGCEGSAEQHLRWVGVHVAEELQQARVGRGLAEDRARLQHDLVGAEVVALEKYELVLVREVQRALRIGLDTKMQRLDSLGARVGAGVAGREQLGSAEASLAIEDGLVVDGDLDRDVLAIELEAR